MDHDELCDCRKCMPQPNIYDLIKQRMKTKKPRMIILGLSEDSWFRRKWEEYYKEKTDGI